VPVIGQAKGFYDVARNITNATDPWWLTNIKGRIYSTSFKVVC
jgi:hypothetical protein